MAGVFYALSCFCVLFGLFTMYVYTSDFGHVVGADAYNYIVIGIRGVGWIVLGLLFAVLGAAQQIIGRLTGQVEEKAPQAIRDPLISGMNGAG